MGAEAVCQVRFNRQVATGKARLESDALFFKSADFTLALPLKDIATATAANGALSITFAGGTAVFELGAAADRWARRIAHPPTLFDKLGVKPESHVAVLGEAEESFLTGLKSTVRHLAIGKASRQSDAIFYFVADERHLARIATLKRSLQPAGALWIVRPKGRRDIPEAAVRSAALAAGLVDVKVVSFSPTHTAEKFVIPLADRPPAVTRRPQP